MNFEKARLSQADADHEVQGDRKYRGEDRENNTVTRGEGKVMLQDLTRKCKDVNCVAKKPGVEHGSHRDEEAQGLNLSGYAGLVQ